MLIDYLISKKVPKDFSKQHLKDLLEQLQEPEGE